MKFNDTLSQYLKKKTEEFEQREDSQQPKSKTPRLDDREEGITQRLRKLLDPVSERKKEMNKTFTQLSTAPIVLEENSVAKLDSARQNLTKTPLDQLR